MVVIVIIMHLAAGHLDLVMEHQLAIHDFMALVPVLKGAGAIVTDWSGQVPDSSSDGSLLRLQRLSFIKLP